MPLGTHGAGVQVSGLQPLLKELRGPLFRKVNSELRDQARFIADEIVPEVQRAVALSSAPQAPAFVRTVKSKRDRIPVVVIGATNPQLRKFSRRGPRKDGDPRLDSRWRRGAMAHGIIYGPKPTGPRTAPDHGHTRRFSNPYRTPRDSSGGVVMRAIRQGPAYQAAAGAYVKVYRRTLARHGFETRSR